ncbi:hypothetical protein BD769DRAFT_1675249 [Suillus cothurnatus]|nr:hypothetical protein BD769DRAFT_1675249 [Suillus cothurnatus]
MSVPPFNSTPIPPTPNHLIHPGRESAGWKVYNTAELNEANMHKLLNSGIPPRPIALVSTISDGDIENLAPYSWFNIVKTYPPVISFGCNNSASGGLKDTAANLKINKGFTVNMVSEAFFENANATAIDAPRDFDEWSISGLTKEKSVQVKASRVKESAVNGVRDINHPVTGEHKSTLIIAHVKYVHVRKDVLADRGIIDITKFKPIARLGDVSYGRVGDAFRMPPPKWAQEEVKIEDALATLSLL